MIYFVHVPKTAGTSLLRLIEQNFPSEKIGYVYPLSDGRLRSDMLKAPRSYTESLEVIYGHYEYGLDRLIGRSGIYVTCLRETRSRLLSSFFHKSRQGLAGAKSMKGDLEYFQYKDWDNCTVRQLSGLGLDAPFGSVNEEHLEQAKKNLIEGFADFGLYEYLPQSIERLCRTAGLEPLPLDHWNVTPREQKAEVTLDEDDIAAAVRHNALDVKLYDFAKEEFLRRLAEPAPETPKAAGEPIWKRIFSRSKSADN